MADEKKDPALPRAAWDNAAAREEALLAAKDRLDQDDGARTPGLPREVGTTTIYGGPPFRDAPPAMPAYGAPPLQVRALPVLVGALLGAALGFGVTGRASMAIAGFVAGGVGLFVLDRLR